MIVKDRLPVVQTTAGLLCGSNLPQLVKLSSSTSTYTDFVTDHQAIYRWCVFFGHLVVMQRHVDA